jgi:hypothetical protein
LATYPGLRQLWRPPTETLEAIAGVLGAHWRAAATMPGRLFWPDPGTWLRMPRVSVVPAHLASHHFTTGGKLIR